MSIHDIIQSQRDEILRVASQHGALNVRVFGSVARGEADENSDVDFLVEMGSNRSFFFPGGLIMDLQDLLQRKVDVITENSLPEKLREKVLKEAIAL
ncbi:MAG: nucleotidyltransferase family protein [bacterium]